MKLLQFNFSTLPLRKGIVATPSSMAWRGETQKYLGCNLAGLTCRPSLVMEHRTQFACANFRKHRNVLMSKYASLKLKSGWFDSTIFLTIRSPLPPLPLTNVQKQSTNILIRGIIRTPVGWVEMLC